MKRKSPILHTVKRHKRQGRWVESFERGSGRTLRKTKHRVVGDKSHLKQKAKEELLGRLTVHTLVKLTSGERDINVIDRKIQKEVLTSRLKSGWILSKDFDENRETIVQWERERDFVNTTRREIKELENGVVSMREQIIAVESGGYLKSLKPMLPKYRKILKGYLEDLPIKKQQLKRAMVDYKPLNRTIKSLKENFKIYLSQLEDQPNE